MNDQDNRRHDRHPSATRTFAHPRIHNHLEVVTCDVIGDIHGCYDELAELMVRLGHENLLAPDLPVASPETLPRLIFVGDIVDRGDRIMDALRLVHRLCVSGYALTVIGNHDYRFERWLRGRDVHLEHGLQETVREFESLPAGERESWRSRLIEFYAALPWAIRFDLGRAIVAHAAWHADLAHDTISDDHIRSYAMYGPTTGRRSPEGYPDRIDWAPNYHGPEFVIFGHQVYPEPYRNTHAIGIDTGCVFGGALTALRYPEQQTVSVPSRGARYQPH